jgi:tRNA pseudouridine38-40 synthase
VRTIYSLDVAEEGECIKLRITGNGFLYNMVRIITGTLVQAGKGQLEFSDVEQMLEAKDRTSAGQTAPPQGLTLVSIEYPDGEDMEINY